MKNTIVFRRHRIRVFFKLKEALKEAQRQPGYVYVFQRGKSFHVIDSWNIGESATVYTQLVGFFKNHKQIY